MLGRLLFCVYKEVEEYIKQAIHKKLHSYNVYTKRLELRQYRESYIVIHKKTGAETKAQ